jgi:hypothetical protein
MTYVTIANVTMTIEAARSVEWAGVDVAADVERVRREGNCDGLLAECLAGAEPEHEGDWRDYVSAVCAAAEQGEVVPAWDFEGFWAVVIGRTPSRCVAEFGLTGDRAAFSAWVDEAAVQAWQAGGQGGRMPGEWVEFVERAADVLAAEVAS